MTVLLTGTAGFIGYHLAKKLLECGYTVIGLDNINNYYDVDLKYDRLSLLGINRESISNNKLIISDVFEKFSFIKLDLEDKKDMEAIFANCQIEIVINLAAQAGVRYSLENPYVYLQSNVFGFFNILELSRLYNVKHLIYASSSSVYGSNKKIPFNVHDNVDFPVSFYAATKKSNELMAHCYSHLYNLPVTGLRFFTVYGPWGRPDMAYYKFTDKILQDKPIQVYNYGKMKRDFTYIDDIVDGVYKIITCIPSGNSRTTAPFVLYNIGNNKPVELSYFIEVLEKKIGRSAHKELLPMQPGDVKITYADISDLEKEIGFTPSTSIEDGLDKFVSWYKDYHNLV